MKPNETDTANAKHIKEFLKAQKISVFKTENVTKNLGMSVELCLALALKEYGLALSEVSSTTHPHKGN